MWPKQGDGSKFVRFVHEHLSHMARMNPAEWQDACPKRDMAAAQLELLPHQEFIKHLVSPATTLQRALIAASTGSGKTLIIAELLCNFLNPALYNEAGKAMPPRIIIITQNASLREQIFHTLENDTRCARAFGKPPRIGRLDPEKHKNWWGARWVKGHATPVDILTYGAAVNRDVSFFRDAVVVLDEAHTLVDTSALAASQRNKVLPLRKKLERATPSVMVGLTGSPAGRGWRDFVTLFNAFCLDKDRIDPKEFERTYIKYSDISDSHRHLMDKCVVGTKKKPSDDQPSSEAPETHGRVPVWAASDAAARALSAKLAPYVYYYDGTFDATRYPVVDEERHDVAAPSVFSVTATHTKQAKVRASFARTRLVATWNAAAGTAGLVDRLQTLADVKHVSPITYQLIKNLAKRVGKTAIYTDIYAPLGSTFVFQVLNKFKAEWADSSAPLFYLKNDDSVGARSRTIEAFNKHGRTGEHAGQDRSQTPPTASAVLVLGPAFSTGIDLKGAVREMHLLSVLPNVVLEEQARGRARRSCSHAGLPHIEWHVKYVQYHLHFEHQSDSPRSSPSPDTPSQTSQPGTGPVARCSRSFQAAKAARLGSRDQFMPLYKKAAIACHPDKCPPCNIAIMKELNSMKDKMQGGARRQRQFTQFDSCDDLIAAMRAKQDSVMAHLKQVLLHASLGCKAMAAHHMHDSNLCVPDQFTS